MKDQRIAELIQEEANRQLHNVELIASENFVSKDILEACGSVLTNKYAEGYPGKRYYGGCYVVDQVEQLAIDRAKALFGAQHANVQPHSGSQANMGVYMAILKPGDTVLGMNLVAGGHLTHGHPLNFSGTLYHFVDYGVKKDSEQIDYDEVLEKALKYKPKLIVAGASAYAREIDFKKFREIADACGAYLMVDMAHIAGLIAAGEHSSPIPYADFVTTTTHKTLRGPRGGVIFCKEKYAKLIDKTVFPGIQGGPLMHIIAAKAVCFEEASKEEFKEYAKQVKSNIQAMVTTFKEEGFRIVSDGSDNHLLMVDVKGSIDMTGKKAEELLDTVAITCNKNTIPFDSEKPFITSGIRIGTAAMTSRGFKEAEFIQVTRFICKTLKNAEDIELHKEIRKEVIALTSQYPVIHE